MITEITSLKQYNEVIQFDGLTVIDFYATWCGPCKMISPVVEKLSEQYSQVHFFKVDVDNVPDVAAENGITGMPTFVLFKKGNKVEEVVGAKVDRIKAVVQEHA